jgi:hypothetical protein
MRDHIDQPKARKAQQADKDQGNGVYDHAMPITHPGFPGIRISRGRQPVSNLIRNNRLGRSPAGIGAKRASPAVGN